METSLNTNMSLLYNQAMLNKTRRDKFIMVVTPPEILRPIVNQYERNNSNVNLDSFQFSVYGVVVPTISIPEVETKYAGQVLKVSSHARPSYGNVSVNFTVDNLFNNYWFVYSWLKILNDDKISIPNAKQDNMDPKLNEYGTTITVYGLDEYNNNKIKFEYTGAIPVELGGINYNYRDSSEAESTFTFSFFQFQATLV
jgi:hypothetical protein